MVLQKWEIFQDEATNFLSDYFNINCAMENGYDSTTSEITVRDKTKLLTTIEAKFTPAQAGQIILSTENNKFSFCDKSKNEPNSYSDKIIGYLNANFSSFVGNNEALIPIDISDTILFNWVKNIYFAKNVDWIIASNKFNNLTKNDLLFVPLDEIENYFDISLVFRRKKSGNVHIPSKDILSFQEELDLITKDYKIKKTNKKYLLTLNKRVSNFDIGEKYLLSMTNTDCQYYIKKKDINTNPNIMFKLSLKNNIKFKDDRFREDYSL